MPDPFESSRRKIERAKEHFSNLDIEIRRFLESKPYGRFIEPDIENPNELAYKIKLTTLMPQGLPAIVGDAVNNLRQSLDHALFGIAKASGCIDPHNTYFPFSGSPAKFEDNMRGRCKDVPQQIYPFLRSLQPYPGGNDSLCALNDLCNADKHRILTTVGTGVFPQKFSIKASCLDGYVRVPRPHTWDRAKQEMTVFISGGNHPEVNYEFDFALFVALNEVKGVDGQPALGILNELVHIVESILLALEAESRRLGFDK